MNPWNDPTMQKIGGLITLGVALVIFLVCRELVCWYFKINVRLAENEKQTRILKKILLAIERPTPGNADAPSAAPPDDTPKA